MTYLLGYIQGISFREIRYGIFFGGLLLAVLLFLHVKKDYPIRCVAAAMALYAFLFVVFASTVFSRPDYGYYNYNLELFWSHRVAREQGKGFMETQIFLNMLILVPVGFLFPLAASHARFGHTFLFGLLCTGLIEGLQLVLRRGLFEWDDMVHNMIGLCVGYAVFWVFKRTCRHRRNV